MTIPTWPSGVPFKPLVEGFSWIPNDDPDATPMERGNTRLRTYPGINIAETTFGILMTVAQYTTFLTWHKTTVNRGSVRWTMDIYDGSSTITGAIVQNKAKPEFAFPEPKRLVKLNLRVFNG